jgi:ubiquinone/menaquinone biosynthesis C-methylase UbiE
MKIRDSGMPDETMWKAFFDPIHILKQLQLPGSGTIVDLGCGYGTFAIPAARMSSGKVIAFDIESEMIKVCRAKSISHQLKNIHFEQRDFLELGTGLKDTSVDYCMLFNIMHTSKPLLLLEEAHRILLNGGTVAIIHWNYNPKTPRGPAMDIRPRPESVLIWLKQSGFDTPTPILDLPPYHYGILGTK